MSREIKFRAWDSVEKKMFVPDAIMNDGRAIVITFAYDKEKFPIMQFTGLTDKNGKEIYEGDKLNDSDNRKMVVKFGLFEAGKGDWDIRFKPIGFYITFEDGGEYILNDDGDGYSVRASECEIIGNIYENP